MNTWQVTPYLFLYLGSVAACLALLVAARRRRFPRGASYFALFVFFSMVWILGYLLGFFNTDLAWKRAMLRVEFLGVICANYMWLVFVAAYAHYDRWIHRRNLIVLALIPFLTILQVLFLGSHDLFYRSYGLTVEDGLVISSKDYGPGFWLWMGWSYLVFLLGNFILLHRTVTLPRHLRGVSGILVLVVAVLTTSHVLYITGNNPIAPYDPTPLSFSVAAMLLLFSMRVHRFLDINPAAQEVVFANLNGGVLITDERAQVIQVNPAAASWLGRTEREIVGEPLSALLPGWDPEENETDQPSELLLGMPHDPRILEVRATPMQERGKTPQGDVILLQDITRRKKLESEQDRLIGELTEALAEIKTLRGLLPICSGCKRIREEEGAWTQVEVYIRDNSDADFTHGICPECFEELYPNMELEQQ